MTELTSISSTVQKYFKDILLVAMWILLLNQRIRVDQLAKRHRLRQGSPNYDLRGQTGSPSHFTLSWKDFVNNQEMIFLQKIVVDLVECNIFRNNHNVWRPLLDIHYGENLSHFIPNSFDCVTSKKLTLPFRSSWNVQCVEFFKF